MDLNQVTIFTHRPLETAEFYQKLGLRLIVDSLPRYARFEFPAGTSTLSVHEAQPAEPQRSIVLYFECDGLDAEYRRLTEDGIRFDSAPEDKPWLWRECRLQDPAGNEICLFSAGKNRRDPPWRVE